MNRETIRTIDIEKAGSQYVAVALKEQNSQYHEMWGDSEIEVLRKIADSLAEEHAGSSNYRLTEDGIEVEFTVTEVVPWDALGKHSVGFQE